MKTQLSRLPNQNSVAAESIERLEKVLTLPRKAGAALNVVFIYEDADTREWAGEMNERISRLAASHPVRPTWWRLNNLCEPGVLAGAVSTAMRADAIVLAVRAEEGLPLPFYAWVNNWLPHRLQPGGVLIALIGKSCESTRCSGRVGDYLRTVGRQSGLNFLMDHRRNKPSTAANGSIRNGHMNGQLAATATVRKPTNLIPS